MTTLLEVRHLARHFAARRGPWLAHAPAVRAVDDVSFSIREGEAFGLVGESGCGKTTTARCVLRLERPTAGTIRFRDTDVTGLRSRELRAFRRAVQMVFQDPYSALDPRMRAGDSVEEPLIIHRAGPRGERRARVRRLFDLVGLDAGQRDRFPHELSGGQRQRIGLARALALEPELLVADEPVSALDVSVQAQVINLLMDLQQAMGLTLLLISHDLRLVRHACARVAIMYRGRLVEMGPTPEIFGAPAHAYTRALLSAVPVADPDAVIRRERFDEDAFDASVPLREIAHGHHAAVAL